MTDKLCVFCVHYQWSEPYEYSDHTAGDGSFSCLKGHSEAYWNAGFGSLYDYRAAITYAAECKDYEQVR